METLPVILAALFCVVLLAYPFKVWSIAKVVTSQNGRHLDPASLSACSDTVCNQCPVRIALRNNTASAKNATQYLANFKGTA